MTEAALFICIDCEVAGLESEPSPLSTRGSCLKCGSMNVLSVENFVAITEKAQRDSELADRPNDTEDWRARHKALVAQRKRDVQPFINFVLTTLKYPTFDKHPNVAWPQLNASAAQAMKDWDGWGFTYYTPWDDNSPSPGFFVVVLTQSTTKDPRQWTLVIDVHLNEVRS